MSEQTIRWDVENIRLDFPMLSQSMNGKPLVYFDNAASTQKPMVVIERMRRFMAEEYANIHRGVYTISQKATEEVDRARETCRVFLGAREAAEILFVRGATEGINLVATSFGRKFLKEGEEVLVSEIEHHSNIVPWQNLCQEKKLKLGVIPVMGNGELDMAAYEAMLGPRVKLVAFTHVSNALGSVNPAKKMIELAHRAGAVTLLDGAQSAPHLKVDVVDLDCDFFCFSGHKVYGPTGIGVLYGKRKLLEAMDPYQFGGDMIESVSFEKTTYARIPQKFEAGTPAITEILGLGAALEYLMSIGLERAARYEEELLREATRSLLNVPGLRVIGEARQKASLVSFVIEGIHPHDVGTVLSEEGVAVRAGHHCAQPTMKHFKVPATTRASFSFYNRASEIGVLTEALKKTRWIFS